jgi:hypothetical protein
MSADQLKDDIHDIDKRITVIESTLIRLETNHLAHIEASMAKMEENMAEIDRRMWTGVVVFLAQALFVSISAIGFLLTRLL